MQNDLDITKGSRKRTRKRVRNLERLHEDSNHPVPGHQAAADSNSLADGYTEQMHADECKSAADMAQSATRARGGGGSASVGAYNAQRDGGSRRVAVGSPDLQQQPSSVFGAIIASLRTTNPESYVGGAAFNSAFGGTDRPAEAPGDSVRVAAWDAAEHAGSFAGMQEVDTASRDESGYCSAPIGARNGSHSLGSVESTAVSNKSRLDIMREAMFGA
jgi:hypothetical protein